MPDTKSYRANGKIYDIPEDKIQEFLSTYPDAIEVQSFSAGDKIYDIPLDKVDSFKETYPDANIISAKPEKKKGVKDYAQEGWNFVSKLPGFTVDWGERFASGALRMPKQTGQGAEQLQRNKDGLFDLIQKYEYEALGIPEETAEKITNTLKRFLPIPGNKINTGFEVTEGLYNLVKDTEEFQSIEDLSNKLYEKSDRYEGKGIIELAKEGDWDAAAGAFILFGAESMPQSIVAAAGGPAGAASLGLMVAGEKYDSLLEREDMSEAMRMLNSNLTGALEMFTEYMGSVQIGKIMKDILAKGGKKQLKEFTEKAARNWYTRLIKKAGMFSPPFIEGGEEFANKLGENIVARYTGEDPERYIWDGVIEQTLRGISGGGHFTGAGLSMQGIQKLTQRIEESRTPPTEPTDKTPEPPAEKPTGDKTKIPKVPPTQPPIPTYKIGETEYENKDTFLSEIEKLKGQKDVDFTVSDDDVTMAAALEILGPQIKEDVSKQRIEGEPEVARPERVGEEPGRAVQEPGEGIGEAEAGRVFLRETPVESLLASTIGKITGSFETPKKPRKMGKRQETLIGLYENIRDYKVETTEDAAEKQKVADKWNTEIASAKEMFTTGTIASAQKKSINMTRDVFKEFLSENRKELSKAYGNAVPTMITRVNNIKTPESLESAMRYINKVVADVGQKQKQKTINIIIKEASPAKKLETKKGKERAKYSYLNRINTENIELSKAITEQIERRDPDAVEQELSEVYDKISRLEEGQANPEAINELRNQAEILEYGRVWDMTQEELDITLTNIKDTNKYGRTEASRTRRAMGKKTSRMRTALNKAIGHPEFARGAAQLKKKGVIKQGIFTLDVDFPAILNQFERNVGKKIGQAWDVSLMADINRDINTEKLGKHKNTYDSIENDIEALKQNMESELEDNPFADRIRDELKDFKKENVEDFIDNWYDDVSPNAQKAIDNFTKTIEKKYDAIRRETKAWLKPTFSTGPMQRMFHTQLVRKGEEQTSVDWFNRMKELNDGLEEILGVKGERLKRKLINLKDELTVFIPYTDHNGSTVEAPLTAMQALHKWLEYEMGDRMNNFTTPQEYDKEGNIVGGMGWDEKSFEALEEAMTPELRELGKFLVEKRREIIEEVQPAYIKSYGIKLDLIENYVESIVVPNKYNGDHQTLLEKNDVMRGVSSDRFKKRTKNNYPLAFVDAIDSYRNYVADMLRFKNMSEPVRIIESVFFDPGVRNHIESQLGEMYYSQIKHYIDRWAGRARRQNLVLLDNMLNNVSLGLLGLKTAVGFKQTFSSLQYAADPSMSMAELVKGMVEMAPPTELNKSILKLLDIQPYFSDRMGAMRGLDVTLDVYSGKFEYLKDKEKQSKIQKAYNKGRTALTRAQTYVPTEKAKTFTMMFLKYGDRFPAVVGGGVYLKTKYKHFSRGQKLTAKIIEEYMAGNTNKALDRALEEWSIMSEATQQSTRISKVSNLRASGSIIRMFTQFTSGPAQLARNTLNAARNVTRGENVMGNLKAIMVSSFVSGALFGLSDMGFKLDDDEDKKEYIWRILINNFKGIAIAGRGLSLALNIAFDKPWARATLTQSAVTDLMWDVGEAAVNLGQGDLEKEKKQKYIEQLVVSLATLNGIPADEMVDIYQVAEKAVEGDIDIMELLMLRNPEETEKVGTLPARPIYTPPPK